MKLSQNFLSIGKKARSGKKFMKTISEVVIHWIGPYPTHKPDGIRKWWESGTDGKGVVASAHFVLKDDEVLQCLPLDEIGWHSGDDRNNFSIGIEVVPENIEGKFSDKSIATLKELIAYIKKNIPTIMEITRHYSGKQGKDCPRFYTPVTASNGLAANPPGGEERWNELLKKITF